jgi:putative copper export protein
MAGSINFLFHIIGFGFLSVALVGGWILERRIRSEKDLNQKLFIVKINRRFGILSIISSVVLLLTGIINIISRFGGEVNLWNTSGWLIAKIILFAFLLVNGAVFGPILVRRRTKFMQGVTGKSNTDDTDANFKVLNKSISTFYLVQFLLLIIILYLSIIGGGKHPGII